MSLNVVHAVDYLLEIFLCCVFRKLSMERHRLWKIKLAASQMWVFLTSFVVCCWEDDLLLVKAKNVHFEQAVQHGWTAIPTLVSVCKVTFGPWKACLKMSASNLLKWSGRSLTTTSKLPQRTSMGTANLDCINTLNIASPRHAICSIRILQDEAIFFCFFNWLVTPSTFNPLEELPSSMLSENRIIDHSIYSPITATTDWPVHQAWRHHLVIDGGFTSRLYLHKLTASVYRWKMAKNTVATSTARAFGIAIPMTIICQNLTSVMNVVRYQMRSSQLCLSCSIC